LRGNVKADRHVKNLATALVVLFVTACASEPPKTVPGTNLEQKSFALPARDRPATSRTIGQLESEVRELNQFIGSYPPRLGSEAERTAAYETWAQALVDAWALRPGPQDEEKTLYLLSELYRQGHNLDVTDSARLAEQTVEGCLQKFPKSVTCHLSASYFYLSLGPKFLPRAERSLDTLRAQYAPRAHPEVERGYVFLYLFRRDAAKASSQIDYFLHQFPGSPERDNLLKIRQQLGGGIGAEEH
jgi:hypothetical protein